MRPGWGTRHPDVARLLQRQQAIAAHEEVWGDGALPLRITAYEGTVELPDDLVLSVRCLVTVGGGLVVCTNRDGSTHPWPGGRREAGESLVDTACREVHEETGWHLEPGSLERLGWLHLERLVSAADPRYPHPDFFQVVYAGRATSRDSSQGEAWSDTEGYEISSRLVPLADVIALMEPDPACRAFIERI